MIRSTTNQAATQSPPTAAARTGRGPDFVIIGAMKSGTTTLYEYLCRHPRVFMCTPKEPQYFSRDHVRTRGADWYRGLFRDARPDQLCGEASTCYTRAPRYAGVPARLRADLPEARLIYLMRHPVERAFSHYGHLMQEWLMQGRAVLPSFEEALAEEAEIMAASRYEQQLELYWQHFPPTQVLLLTLDELKRDPAATLRRVQVFLGLEAQDLTAEAGPVQANAWSERMTRHHVRGLYRRARDLAGRLGVRAITPGSIRAWARRTLLNSRLARRAVHQTVTADRAHVAPLQPATRAALLREFARTTDAIAELTKQNLDAWRA